VSHVSSSHAPAGPDSHSVARIEELREADKKAEVARQEMMLKLISAELTKNTTRVVEMAVKAEVQSSVLPALENITRNEIKAAVNGQITRGLSESMKQARPFPLNIAFVTN
jgi:hypothetical protein